MIGLYFLYALVLIQHIVNGMLIAYKSNIKQKKSTLFVAHQNSRVVHTSTCRYSITIPVNKSLKFTTIDDAVIKGYRPCKYCLPDEYKNKKAT
jgi:methylphosphotriester-DNA--protein-cysteine methyltransferase